MGKKALPWRHLRSARLLGRGVRGYKECQLHTYLLRSPCCNGRNQLAHEMPEVYPVPPCEQIGAKEQVGQTACS